MSADLITTPRPRKPPPIARITPPPGMVWASRACLIPRYAIGVVAFFGEYMRRPLPDRDAIGGGHRRLRPCPARRRRAAIAIGGGRCPWGLLAATRLDLDQIEARLLDAAHASVTASPVKARLRMLILGWSGS
jgi:hypothetical protein